MQFQMDAYTEWLVGKLNHILMQHQTKFIFSLGWPTDDFPHLKF